MTVRGRVTLAGFGTVSVTMRSNPKGWEWSYTATHYTVGIAHTYPTMEACWRRALQWLADAYETTVLRAVFVAPAAPAP